MIGATGYVGARLVPHLLSAGHAVRVLVRDPAKLDRLPWAHDVERVVGDVDSAADRACTGVEAVFYLVHSMDGPGYAGRDRAAAERLAAAAGEAGVRRVVYLGGLQPAGEENSEHLASRRETGDALLAGPVPAAVLQAGIVVGAGSASFEMIRHLATLSPVLPLPDRAWNAVQPIGIDDVLHHLTACLELAPEVNRTFDIGGAEVLSFRELMTGFATVAGRFRPLTVPLPVSAPRMLARAVEALTPVDRHLAGPLLESMAHDLVVRDDPPNGPPPGGPTPYAETVRRALAEEGAAGRAATDLPEPVLHGEHVEDVEAPAAVLWEVISGIGGDNGWYTVPGVWALRGGIDRLLGGVGARRTRAARPVEGAALDWWRVEEVDEGRSLTLRAETKLPGTVHLELRAEPVDAGRSRYVQRVVFRPDGLTGRAYWYAQLPAHDFVFAVMARTIAGVARTRARRGAATRRAATRRAQPA
ncbi:SDR family oxidoreductase [Pseudonocardia petroleophila]|uniref:SDR family oxidoreductase n=1 Tax=Pseudonocardia petroleophila TaxID=37331 RepID=A0A7G7MDL5_9PSEU|nr:SDR family oxidoreductase [Pseudonocardia petroleophila]QNG50876.1 SDR family oxidoreductase [Pseudonocardia petroleophila]